METYQSYYSQINKPFFAPEPQVFGMAWGIIYPLIAIAFLVVAIQTYKRTLPTKAFIVFVANLILNFAFTPLQLGFPEAPWATLDILAILGTLIWLLVILLRHKAWLPFLLLLPYILWVGFATILQVTIYFLNFT